MELRVYISQLKDENFDYDIQNLNGDRQYAPIPIGPFYRINDIFQDITRKVNNHTENTKKTDWGTYVIKLKNTNLIQYLSEYVSYYEQFNSKYEQINHGEYKFPDWSFCNSLLVAAKKLPDGEYLLVGQELF